MSDGNFFHTYAKSSRSGVLKPYANELAVSVTKSGITLVDKAFNTLGRPARVLLLWNERQWAIQPAPPDNVNGYAVAVWQGDEAEGTKYPRRHLTCKSFIRDVGMPLGVYVGVWNSGKLIFPSTPVAEHEHRLKSK